MLVRALACVVYVKTRGVGRFWSPASTRAKPGGFRPIRLPPPRAPLHRPVDFGPRTGPRQHLCTARWISGLGRTPAKPVRLRPWTPPPPASTPAKPRHHEHSQSGPGTLQGACTRHMARTGHRAAITRSKAGSRVRLCGNRVSGIRVPRGPQTVKSTPTDGEVPRRRSPPAPTDGEVPRRRSPPLPQTAKPPRQPGPIGRPHRGGKGRLMGSGRSAAKSRTAKSPDADVQPPPDGEFPTLCSPAPPQTAKSPDGEVQLPPQTVKSPRRRRVARAWVW